MKIQTVGTPSGSVGPVTTFKGRYGSVQRNRVTPLNPQTTYQQNIRAILASVASEWRGLTEAIRAAWWAFAAQLPGNQTGFLAYVKINHIRVLTGQPKFEEPPALPAFGIFSATGLTATLTAGELALALAGAANTLLPDTYIVEGTPPVSPGIQNQASSYRIIKHGALATLADLADAYVAKFGLPLVGQRVSVRVSQVKNGLKGVPFAYATIVEAGA